MHTEYWKVTCTVADQGELLNIKSHTLQWTRCSILISLYNSLWWLWVLHQKWWYTALEFLSWCCYFVVETWENGSNKWDILKSYGIVNFIQMLRPLTWELRKATWIKLDGQTTPGPQLPVVCWAHRAGITCCLILPARGLNTIIISEISLPKAVLPL